jgi:hypothetical protein
MCSYGASFSTLSSKSITRFEYAAITADPGQLMRWGLGYPLSTAFWICPEGG